MKSAQLAALEKLLTRREGVTSMEIIQGCHTTAPHRRMTDLKERGWEIHARKLGTETYKTYFGIPPYV